MLMFKVLKKHIEEIKKWNAIYIKYERFIAFMNATV